MAREFQDRGAVDIASGRHMKHLFGSFVDDQHVALGVEHDDALDHAAQDRIGLFFLTGDLHRLS